MNMIFGGNSLSVGGVPVEIKGCISKATTSNSSSFPSLTSSDATNGIGWYNVSLYYSYQGSKYVSAATGNLYFDGTNFNGFLAGMYKYDGSSYTSYADILIVVVNNKLNQLFKYDIAPNQTIPVNVVNAGSFPA